MQIGLFDRVPVVDDRPPILREIEDAIRALEARPELMDVDFADVRRQEGMRHLVLGRDLLQVLRRHRDADPRWHGSTFLRLTLDRAAELLRFTPPPRVVPAHERRAGRRPDPA